MHKVLEIRIVKKISKRKTIRCGYVYTYNKRKSSEISKGQL